MHTAVITDKYCLSGRRQSDIRIPPLPFPRSDPAQTVRGLPSCNCQETTSSPLCVSSILGFDQSELCSKREYKYPSYYHPITHEGKEEEGSRTSVISLPWSDSKGRDAKYTGQVNELIQPHGFGCLQYNDGSVFTSEFINGTPIVHSSSPSQDESYSSLDNLRVLKLGDVASPQDMHIEFDSQRQYENVESLAIHSFAFILRSTGDWTYAIISDRPVESGPDASIRFVLNSRGSTKTIKAKNWSTHIRLVRDRVVKRQEIKQELRESVQDERDISRLSSFHRAARRVSFDMSRKNGKKGNLRRSTM